MTERRLEEEAAEEVEVQLFSNVEAAAAAEAANVSQQRKMLQRYQQLQMYVSLFLKASHTTEAISFYVHWVDAQTMH